jgi:Serine/threonine protein kinase
MVVEHYMHPPVHGEHLDILLPGRYENLRRIGSGATSIVYRAHDRFLDLPVAIKCLKSHHSDYHHVRMFQKEAKLMSSLSFVNLPRVFDFGLSQDGHPYMVMELVEGHSLRSMLARRRSLSISTSLTIFLQICSALAYAHNHGIAHRDLKAGNIMITWNTSGEPVVKLVDFGLASTLNQEPDDRGVAVGTPLYMSPEQAMGRPTDARSDIYSFGCLMFETLTGHLPIKGDSAAETLAMHIGTRAPLLSKYLQLHSQSLQEMEIVIAVALEKEPGDRYQSIEELEQALLAVASCEAGVSVEGLFGTGNHRRLNALDNSVANIDTVSGAMIEVGYGAAVSDVFKENLQEIASTTPIGRLNVIENGRPQMSVSELGLLIPEVFESHHELDDTANDLCSPMSHMTNSHEALAACLKAKFQTSRPAGVCTNEAKHRMLWRRVLDVRIISILTMLVLSGLLVGSIVNSMNANELARINAESLLGSNEQLSGLLRHDLVISGTKVWCMPVTTVRELERVQANKSNVTYLGLCGTQFNGDGLDFIEEWPIETLDARGLRLSENGFAILGRVKTLSRLRLNMARGLTGAKMERLHSLPKLTELVLNNSSLSDGTIEAVANLHTLKGLYLNHTDLNDAKLAKLAKMKSLNQLAIDGCRDVSDDAIQAFRAARPDVELTI